METLTPAAETFGPILARLASSPSAVSQSVGATIARTLDVPAGGTMAAWFKRYHGYTVTTVQLGGHGSVWAPTGRMIDAQSAKGSVKLDGSTRDYKGMTVLHASLDCLIVRDDWHTIAYVLEGN